jgi:hypothetical protein
MFFPIVDQLRSVNVGSKRLGFIIAWFCHAERGGWETLRSRTGRYYGGRGTQNMLAHESWTAWVDRATPDQAP